MRIMGNGNGIDNLGNNSQGDFRLMYSTQKTKFTKNLSDGFDL